MVTFTSVFNQCKRTRPQHLSSLARQSVSTWDVDSTTGIISSKGESSKFQTVIGLEIHAQLDIPTKLFSGCPRPTTSFPKPNSHVWPFDVGVPGFLPILSIDAVQAAILSAAALNCEIPRLSRFERKHYFYADSPLGYQVTQQRWPIAKGGRLTCQFPGTKKSKSKHGESFSAGIDRIQLEQDTGKTITINRKDGTIDSLVDFNRAGCALIEIVFNPDLRSSIQAATTVETLRGLLRHIGTCDGKMEDGSLRCDLNVSIAPLEGDSHIVERAGNRVEVKNLNSIRQIQLAAEYEAIRQAEVFMKEQPTAQETRTFDVKAGKTVVIRTKEGAKDYRFMPEPDLPPISLDSETLDGMDLASFLESRLPELPDEARNRLETSYGVSPYMAKVLISDPPAIGLFDEAMVVLQKEMNTNIRPKIAAGNVANLLCNELFALVREHESAKAMEEEVGAEASVKFSKVDGNQLGVVALLLSEGSISSTMAKQLLRILYIEEAGKDPRSVAKARGFQLIKDAESLKSICHSVIEENPLEMEKYRQGGKFAKKILKFLLGKGMQKSQGNAHPERLNEIMLDVLREVEPAVDI